MASYYAELRDAFGTVVATGTLELAPDLPVYDEVTMHDQWREHLTGKRMRLQGSTEDARMLYDISFREQP